MYSNLHLIEHIHQSVPFTPYDTRWVPCSARFVAMGIMPNGKGAIKCYQLNKGTTIHEFINKHMY